MNFLIIVYIYRPNLSSQMISKTNCNTVEPKSVSQPSTFDIFHAGPVAEGSAIAVRMQDAASAWQL